MGCWGNWRAYLAHSGKSAEMMQGTGFQGCWVKKGQHKAEEWRVRYLRSALQGCMVEVPGKQPRQWAAVSETSIQMLPQPMMERGIKILGGGMSMA